MKKPVKASALEIVAMVIGLPITMFLFFIGFLLDMKIVTDFDECFADPTLCTLLIAITIIIIIVEIFTPDWPVILWTTTSSFSPLLAFIFNECFAFVEKPHSILMFFVLFCITLLLVALFNVLDLSTTKKWSNDLFLKRLFIGMGFALCTSLVLIIVMIKFQAEYSTTLCCYISTVSPATAILLTAKTADN